MPAKMSRGWIARELVKLVECVRVEERVPGMASIVCEDCSGVNWFDRRDELMEEVKKHGEAL